MERLWATTEDGFAVCIHLPPIWDTFEQATAGGWWPPIGLRLTESRDDSSLSDPTVTHFGLLDREQSSIDRLESDLGLFVAEHLQHLVAVHSALITDGEKTLIFPGRSMSGKTTICSAAISAGLTVLSDEYTLIDPNTGLVRGWPRRLRVRVSDGAVRVPINSHSSEFVRVTQVAHLSYSAEVSYDDPLEVSSLSEAEAIFALLDNTVCARSRPQFALDGALSLARYAPGIRGLRGEAAAAIVRLFTGV